MVLCFSAEEDEGVNVFFFFNIKIMMHMVSPEVDKDTFGWLWHVVGHLYALRPLLVDISAI